MRCPPFKKHDFFKLKFLMDAWVLLQGNTVSNFKKTVSSKNMYVGYISNNNENNNDNNL